MPPATASTYFKLRQMSTKILGSSDDANKFINYLSANQVDINPLLTSESKLVRKILEYRDSSKTKD